MSHDYSKPRPTRSGCYDLVTNALLAIEEMHPELVQAIPRPYQYPTRTICRLMTRTSWTPTPAQAYPVEGDGRRYHGVTDIEKRILLGTLPLSEPLLTGFVTFMVTYGELAPIETEDEATEPVDMTPVAEADVIEEVILKPKKVRAKRQSKKELEILPKVDEMWGSW